MEWLASGQGTWEWHSDGNDGAVMAAVVASVLPICESVLRGASEWGGVVGQEGVTVRSSHAVN